MSMDYYLLCVGQSIAINMPIGSTDINVTFPINYNNAIGSPVSIDGLSVTFSAINFGRAQASVTYLTKRGASVSQNYYFTVIQCPVINLEPTCVGSTVSVDLSSTVTDLTIIVAGSLGPFLKALNQSITIQIIGNVVNEILVLIIPTITFTSTPNIVVINPDGNTGLFTLSGTSVGTSTVNVELDYIISADIATKIEAILVDAGLTPINLTIHGLTFNFDVSVIDCNIAKSLIEFFLSLNGPRSLRC